jgi:hypothetical protein
VSAAVTFADRSARATVPFFRSRVVTPPFWMSTDWTAPSTMSALRTVFTA